jgi:hypothetical protein
MDRECMTDIANISDCAQSLDKFFTGYGEDTLRQLLRLEAEVAIELAFGFRILLLCNLTLLALILWRVW